MAHLITRMTIQKSQERHSAPRGGRSFHPLGEPTSIASPQTPVYTAAATSKGSRPLPVLVKAPAPPAPRAMKSRPLTRMAAAVPTVKSHHAASSLDHWRRGITHGARPQKRSCSAACVIVAVQTSFQWLSPYLVRC